MITVGPDGALWFTCGKSNTVGRITIDGKVDSVAVPDGGELWWIAAGPDGNIWFTVAEPGRIGRINLPAAGGK